MEPSPELLPSWLTPSPLLFVVAGVLAVVVVLILRRKGQKVHEPLDWRAEASASLPVVVPQASLAPGALTEVERAVRQGQKIKAIQLYRELTGVGLAEAKAAVEHFERKGFGEASTFDGGPKAPPPDAMGRVEALVDEGSVIEAIKVYREATGVGLKEAKDAVEALRVGRAGSRGAVPGDGGDGTDALEDEVLALLAENRLIDAVQLIRTRRSELSLRDAKALAESLNTRLRSRT